MSTHEKTVGTGQTTGKVSTTDLLEAIRASHVEGRIRQMRQLDRIESACLMIAGGALGTMAAVGIASDNAFLKICGAGAFLIGLCAGIQGLYQHLWPPISKEARRLEDSEKQRNSNGLRL